MSDSYRKFRILGKFNDEKEKKMFKTSGKCSKSFCLHVNCSFIWNAAKNRKRNTQGMQTVSADVSNDDTQM